MRMERSKGKISVTGVLFLQMYWIYIDVCHKNKTNLKNHLSGSTGYFSWNSSFGSKRSCKRLINHISHADCIMLECSAVFLIPFIIYLTFSMEKKRVFLWTIIPWNAELHQVERILMRQFIQLFWYRKFIWLCSPPLTPLSKQPQQ